MTPPEYDEDGDTAPEPDWSVLFEEADLDPARFTPATPAWVPPSYCDARAAWDGPLPGEPETRIRVEAGGYRGKPVFFRVTGPWAKPTEARNEAPDLETRIWSVVGVLVILGVLGGALFLAYRNLRLGRGDRRGANRLAGCVLALMLCSWALAADHVPSLWDEMGLFFVRGLPLVLLVGAFAWIAYVGLEPVIRRRWPDTIVAWNRLVAGRVRDPLVGRSVLIGVTFMVGWDLFSRSLLFLRESLGHPPGMFHCPFPDMLLGGGKLFAGALNSVWSGFVFPLAVLLILLLLRLVFRRLWLAIAVFVLIPPLAMLASGNLWGAPIAFVMLSLIVLALVRFGLLAAIACVSFSGIYAGLLVTLDFSQWYAARLWIPILVVLAISACAFHVAKGGRPLIKSTLKD